ncbi:hypothetical protein HanRHA438_Chr01g0013851 [Helianthus annuus]|nr:hypothetical protein HanPSC8_Chr08g0310731 [Helianthus annuus]KAJ0947312.1 hypothetical protein HanRHA438_Chr01g0013851 [Helianthus annuus]
MLFLEILYYCSRLFVVKSETWIINKIRISLNSPSTYSYMFIRSNSLYIESLFVIHTYTYSRCMSMLVLILLIPKNP